MNNGFKQLAQQLLSIWKHLGVNQRVTLCLAGLLTIGGMAGLAIWSARADYALLYGKLPEGESAKVVSALDEAKVPYKLSSSGGSIMVPADKVHLLRMQLAAKGIPRGDGVGFEIFDKPNFGISDFIQRANYLRAVQGELARTISQVDSIESARVMVVMPENRLLVDQQKKPTASVFVHVRGNGELPPQTVNAIRFLVANAVEGLQANAVTVVDNLGNVLSENSDRDSFVGMTSTQLTARKNFEQYLSKRTEEMLATVLGAGQAVVRVAAEINFDTNTRTEEKYDPDVQIPRIATINDENTETLNGSSGGGVAGLTTNDNSETNVVASAPTTTSHTKKKVTNNQYELNKTTSNLVQAAGGLRRLSAAVFIATRYEGTGTARKPAPRPKEELEKLRRVVQNALGIQETDPQRHDQISLEEMPFNDAPVTKIAEQLREQQKHEFWWNLAGKGFYPLAALGVLFIFWRQLKRTPADASMPLGIPLGELTGNHNNGHGRSQPPVVTVEVLNQLIRENPENMTQAIRSWAGRGKTTN
jgi:flagellar M-ring protein FliF